MVEKGHYRASGLVDFQSGDTRLQADEMDVYETTHPDGTLTRWVVAVGNVVFMRGDERMSGRRLEMDVTAGTGTFYDARGYVQPGLLVDARIIERLDSSTYRVHDATFTSCYQPNPRWNFEASSARIHVDDKVVAHGAVFNIKGVPALYTPLFVYPINSDQRSTGFLLPHVGYSSLRGWDVGDAFFWAMGRSADQTFYFDHYSRYGYGFGHELRYALDPPSFADFKTYAFRVQQIPTTTETGQPDSLAANTWDYNLDWTAVQSLPLKSKATVRVSSFSNLQFQQSIQDNLALASQRTRSEAVNLQRTFVPGTLRVAADSTETLFQDEDGDHTDINRHLPGVYFDGFPLKIPKTPITFSVYGHAEEIEHGDQDTSSKYSRVDTLPRLQASASTSFLTLTPSAAVRYTRYGRSVGEGDEDFLVTGPPIERKYFETNVELDGPNLARVYDNPGKWYSDRFKHVIGPEIIYTYRSPVENFDKIPPSDFSDETLGTNQVQYALVQHLFSRRPAKNGKLTPLEFLTIRLQRTYYFDIDKSQNQFDPAYRSSVYSAKGTVSHNSPFKTEVRFRPTPLVGTSLATEYDYTQHALTFLSVTENLRTDRFGLNATWSKSTRLQVNLPPLPREGISGSGNLEIVPGTLGVDGSVNYDRVNSRLVQSTARLRYTTQCCGFSIESIQYNFGTRVDKQIRFTFELANLGSFGNFNSLGRTGAPGAPY